MFFDALQIELIASGLSFFVSVLILILLFINNNKEITVRYFLFGLMAMIVWSGSKTISYLTGDIEVARFLRIISISFIPLIAASVSNFAVSFYEMAQKNKLSIFSKCRKYINHVAIVFVIALISDLFWSTNIIVGEMLPHPVLKFSPVPGSFWLALVVYFFTVALYSAFIIYKSKKGAPDTLKQQANWIIGSMSLALIAGGGGFAAWYSIPGSSIISIFAAPIFAVGIFYSITKHGLFNIKTTAAELLTFSIWGFLFFRLIFAKTLQEQITEGILLFIVIILGVLLIESVFKEVSQKEELKNLNITLEKKVEERTKEITQSKKHIEKIIESLTIGIVEHDDSFVISRINTAAENMLGINRELIVGKKIPKSSTDLNISTVSKILYLTDPENIETKNTNKNTSTYEITLQEPIKKTLQVTSVPFNERTNTVGIKKYIKLIRDITKEKEIDEAKSNFISIAAHQLRTPLSAIKWVFALALSGSLGKLTKMQKEMFEKGAKSNENMIHIVNDLLDVSRIEKGIYGYNMKKNNIIDTVNEAVDDSRFTIKEKNIDFHIFTPDKDIPEFIFDKDRIKIVLRNILDNAATYTQPGGKIEISIKISGNYVVIETKDNGMGIAKKDLKKIFTKFFRTKKAIQTETDRSGLGLFIAKEIVEAHGGDIKIKSKEEEGTIVIIKLPTSTKKQ